MGGSPPLDPNDESVFVGVRIVGSMADSVDAVAAKSGSTRSAVIREAVAAYLDEHQEVLAS